MDAGERSVLATLAYYGALRWPLTAVEISQRLIPSARLGAPGYVMDIGSLLSCIERLLADGRIRSSSGLCIVGDAPADIAAHRVQRHAVTADKWRRMLRSARWLQAVPYVRMIAGAGSLALGSCSEASDWDVVVVVQARRLYTARLGLLTAAFLMGRLRTKEMRTAPDRFCFNHIITTDGLAVRHRSLFTAHAVAWLVPFYDPWGYWPRLRQANQWLADFVSSRGDALFERRALRRSRVLSVVRQGVELVLNTLIGDGIEYLVRRWMQRRIERVPVTHEKGGRIVADDRELEFHPRSFEAVALARYNASLVRFGLGQYSERDSGLRH